MAVPKRKLSRSNTRSRRANWKADNPALAPVTAQGLTVLAPRRLHKAVTSGAIDATTLPPAPQ